jgi:hypothetical protein
MANRKRKIYRKTEGRKIKNPEIIQEDRKTERKKDVQKDRTRERRKDRKIKGQKESCGKQLMSF